MTTDSKNSRASRVSRRDFIKIAGIGAVSAATVGVTRIKTANAQSWDRVVDVVVVGSGAAAFCATVAALQNNATVAVLEKGVVVGGTTGKSGGAFWIPNSPFMQAAGMSDPRADAIRYMARLAFPNLYRADHPTLGIPQANYKLIGAFYDNGSKVAKKLHDTGAMKSLMGMSWTGKPTPDYFAHLPENKAPRGRTTNPQNPEGKRGFGAHMILQLRGYAESNGADILTGHRVTKIVVDDQKRVVGVEAETSGGTRRFRARKGVVFGSGGFTQNAEMRNNYLRAPVIGGCAVPTNEGDLVNMAIEVGAKLGNMNEAWLQQEMLEEVLEFSSVPSGAWFLGGDSSIAVNKYGRRLYDEKFVYNERTRTHLTWDAQKAEYPNLYQFFLFDQHARDTGGFLIPPNDAESPYLIQGDSWEDLAAKINRRLASLKDRIGRFQLDESFLANLAATIERFNGYAETGKDLEFNRGTVPIDEHFHRPHESNNQPNRWMYPLADDGPYYCIILAAGTLDTKGGPVTNEVGQVVDVHDQPIRGFYAAGNCMASPSGQAYWGAGGTLGPAVTFGYLAGEDAAKQTAI